MASDETIVETRVNTDTDGFKLSPSVTALADGGWVVTWESRDQDGDDGGIYQQRYNSDGSTVADGGTVYIETRVNTDTNGSQAYTSVAALADGGWIVTWTTLAQLGDDLGVGIFQQRYNADGGTVAGDGTVYEETEINTYDGGQATSVVTALADGGWVVAWTSGDDQDGDDWGIYQQRYNADGGTAADDGTVYEETRVNTYADGFQYTPSITALADGGWIVTWESYQDGYGDVFQQRYDADGTTVADDETVYEETQVNTYADDEQIWSSATSLADGGWVVTWTSNDARGDPDSYSRGIYQQRYNADGGTLAADGVTVYGENRVNTYTDHSQLKASVTALIDGGWVVTWESTGQDDPSDTFGYGIYQQRYNADGGTVADDGTVYAETRVNTYTDGDQDTLSATALADGGWIVTWTSAEGPDGGGIYQQRYNSAGVLVALGTGGETNSAPTGITLSDSTVEENVETGTVIGILSGSDPDVGDTLTLSLVANPGNAFAIEDGKLVVSAGADIDFETLASYPITLRVTDAAGLHFDKDFTIAVTDVIDQIRGTINADTLKGATGADIITGLAGKDKLYGEGGVDTFVFDTGDSGKSRAKADTIFDFTKDDKIDLSGWDSDSKAEGIQEFDFIGSRGFSKNHAGELHVVKTKSETWIEGNTDSDKKAEFVIHLDDAVAMKAGYFDGLL